MDNPESTTQGLRLLALNVHPLHPRHRWSIVRPADESLDRVFSSLDHCLHGAIRCVANPAGKAERFGPLTRVVAKGHSLNVTVDAEMQPGES